MRARLVCVALPRYRPAAFTKAPRAGGIGSKNHEARHPSELSHHQGRDDRRHRIHHAHDLGQGGRYAVSRYRPKVAPGVDRRAAATCRPRWTALALPEEICRIGIKEVSASDETGTGSESLHAAAVVSALNARRTAPSLSLWLTRARMRLAGARAGVPPDCWSSAVRAPRAWWHRAVAPLFAALSIAGSGCA